MFIYSKKGGLLQEEVEMLIKTQKAVYEVEKTTNGYIIERIGCSPKGAELTERICFEGDLVVFNPQGELVLFRGEEQVLKTAPMILPRAVTAPKL